MIAPRAQLAAEARAAVDGAAALERVASTDRALALRAAIAITRRALDVAAPRPRSFVSLDEERAWSDEGAGVVDEALALVDELAGAIAAGDDARVATVRARGDGVLARAGALQETIAAAADAYDYDAGSLVLLVVSALVEVALERGGFARVVEAAAWLVPCAAEAALPRDPSTWDRRRALRAEALRDVVAGVVLAG